MIGKKRAPFTSEACSNMSKAHLGKKMPPFTDEHRANISKARIGIKFSDGHLVNLKIASLREKQPLKNGWKSKLSDITTNKESATYLGSIAEIILSHIYQDVRVMPRGNHGYDIICNKDFLIDIKSSAIGDKYGYWTFGITHNLIADYFLCIAFNNREDLNTPAHLWMIPGYVINHLDNAKISKSTIDKWSEYELSLDKLTTCCNSRKTKPL
jgi:hypothetical protein